MKQRCVIYSMQRTGHHAIIFWLVNNFGGYKRSMETYIFWDDNSKLYYYNDCNHMSYYIVTNYKYLLLSYEDTYKYIDHEEDDKVVIILRDFINMLASRYQKYGDKLAFNKTYLQDIDKIIDMWKQHANEVINNKKIVVILYNRWIFEKDYRNQICKSLGIENKSDNISFVPEMGQGSSFCGMTVENNKDEYVNRYKKVCFSNSIKKKIREDVELIDLNKKLFNIDLDNILK